MSALSVQSILSAYRFLGEVKRYFHHWSYSCSSLATYCELTFCRRGQFDFCKRYNSWSSLEIYILSLRSVRRVEFVTQGVHSDPLGHFDKVVIEKMSCYNVRDLFFTAKSEALWMPSRDLLTTANQERQIGAWKIKPQIASGWLLEKKKEKLYQHYLH